MKSPRSVAFAFLAFACIAARADEEIPAEKVGKIQFEEEKEMEKIRSQYGNRKPSEMSSEERRDMAHAEQEALQKVHEANGVSDRDYARRTARMNADERDTARDTRKTAERESVRKEVKAEGKENEAAPKVVPYEEAAVVQAPAGRTPPPESKKSSKKSKHHPDN